MSTKLSAMKHTFYLKKPKSEDETLILFSCYFKYEGKKFVYSTAEKIQPKYWDAKAKKVITRGKTKMTHGGVINMTLGRYTECFEKTRYYCIRMDEEFTSQVLKRALDEEFKRAPAGKNLFYKTFEEFVEFKSKSMDWSPATIKRYKNIKNILKDFEVFERTKLTFNSINEKFYSEFTDYCLNERKHTNYTFSRNVGLLKTFLNWAFKNGYTYNLSFKDFKKKKRVLTNQIALKKTDLERLMNWSFKSERLEKVRDLFILSCTTGIRFGELISIKRENVVDDNIVLKEEKESNKESRLIPLNSLASFIIKKYNFQLPKIVNQKYNEYIKEVFKEVGYDQQVEKVTTRGRENIRELMPFYKRVSSHTARRTFITMMKDNGKPDKLIAQITGHKDLKTLNQYYQVNDESKHRAVAETFDIEFNPLKKAN